MATSLDLAWATFQQHYSQAKQTWWQDHQADYLASVTSANQASSAYQTAVNTAYLIQAVAQADADTTHATDTAGDAKLEEEARAETALRAVAGQRAAKMQKFMIDFNTYYDSLRQSNHNRNNPQQQQWNDWLQRTLTLTVAQLGQNPERLRLGTHP